MIKLKSMLWYCLLVLMSYFLNGADQTYVEKKCEVIILWDYDRYYYRHAIYLRPKHSFDRFGNQDVTMLILKQCAYTCLLNIALTCKGAFNAFNHFTKLEFDKNVFFSDRLVFEQGEGYVNNLICEKQIFVSCSCNAPRIRQCFYQCNNSLSAACNITHLSIKNDKQSKTHTCDQTNFMTTLKAFFIRNEHTLKDVNIMKVALHDFSDDAVRVYIQNLHKKHSIKKIFESLSEGRVTFCFTESTPWNRDIKIKKYTWKEPHRYHVSLRHFFLCEQFLYAFLKKSPELQKISFKFKIEQNVFSLNDFYSSVAKIVKHLPSVPTNGEKDIKIICDIKLNEKDLNKPFRHDDIIKKISSLILSSRSVNRFTLRISKNPENNNNYDIVEQYKSFFDMITDSQKKIKGLSLSVSGDAYDSETPTYMNALLARVQGSSFENIKLSNSRDSFDFFSDSPFFTDFIAQSSSLKYFSLKNYRGASTPILQDDEGSRKLCQTFIQHPSLEKIKLVGAWHFNTKLKATLSAAHNKSKSRVVIEYNDSGGYGECFIVMSTVGFSIEWERPKQYLSNQQYQQEYEEWYHFNPSMIQNTHGITEYSPQEVNGVCSIVPQNNNIIGQFKTKLATLYFTLCWFRQKMKWLFRSLNQRYTMLI